MAEAFGQFQYPTPPLAVFNEEVVAHYQQFFNNRRSLRPAIEYGEVTEQEWAEFEANFPEPGWLPAAYSLLSQVTHSTPIGLMHMTRYRDQVLSGGDISPEMLALALDAACLGSATLIRRSGLMLTQGSDEGQKYSIGLMRRALEVHNTARPVHGLD